MPIIYVIIIALAYYAIGGLAMYKLIKSKLPDREKIFWGFGFVVLQILAFIPFIIYHDYFLSKERMTD